MSTGTNKIVQVTIAALLVGILGWVAIGLLFNATDYTSTTETFTAVNLTAVDLSNTQDLIASGETVSNVSFGTILSGSGANYTMDNSAGTITVNCTDGFMEDGADYTINYHQGAVDSTVSTMSKLMIGLVFFIVIIVIILKYAGIEVK